MRLRIISWETLEKIQKKEDLFIIDLRELKEYRKEHIPGAVWADWERLENDISQLLKKRGRMPQWIVLYCDRGNTSLLMARDLARSGYPVISMNGGFHMWKRRHASSASKQ